VMVLDKVVTRLGEGRQKYGVIEIQSGYL